MINKPKIVVKSVQNNVPVYNNAPVQQTQGSKIGKLKEVGKVDIDPSKAQYFQQLYEDTCISIRDNENFRITPFIHNNAQTYQYINFTFRGKKEYEGKAISGVLKLNNAHPKVNPEFYFNNMKNGQTIEHENIYRGGLLCIVQLNDKCWKEHMSISEILQAVQFIFDNPNFSEVDAPANIDFYPKKEEEKSKIRTQQALLLEDFEVDDL